MQSLLGEEVDLRMGKVDTAFRLLPGQLTSKDLLIRDEDVQVLHGFDTVSNAAAYLTSALFTEDVVTELAPLLDAAPEVRVYDEA